MKEKILTIIVAAYNVDKYLGKGCESCVLEQPWRDRLEVIVVNDGSTDDTSRIAHDFEKKYPSVFCVIDKQNGHYGSCINKGLEQASGLYVKILDGDDAFDTKGLKTLVEKLSAFGEDGPDVVYCDCHWVDAAGDVVESAQLDIAPDTYFELSALMLMQRHIGHPQLVYRTKMLRENGYHQTEGCAYTDVEYYTLPLLWGRKFFYVPISPMRILVEREGRSMAAATYAKQFGTVARLVLGLANQCQDWAGRCPENNYAYVHGLVIEDVRNIYTCCISGICGVMPQLDLALFDDELNRISPQLYAEVAGVSCFYGLKLDLVREWRKKRDINTLRLRLWRFYGRVIVKAAKFKSRIVAR